MASTNAEHDDAYYEKLLARVDNTISDLRIHGEVFDMLGLERSPYNKINIHLGGAYGDK